MKSNVLTVRKQTSQQKIYDCLLNLIVEGETPSGGKLPAISELADRFDTSPRTVHLALSVLETQGYLVKKHGSGTFVASQHKKMTLTDTVAVCMASGSHIWGELQGLLINGLNERHLFPLGIEIAHQNRDELLARFNHTDAGYYMIHGSYTFPYKLFQAPAFQHKAVIALAWWPDSVDWPGLYRVLTDYDVVGDLVARHLWEDGHRRLLIVGPPTDKLVVSGEWVGVGSPLLPVIRAWEKRGGTWEQLTSEGSSESEKFLNEGRVVEILNRKDWPTAIFGTRDFEVWQAQQMIQRRLPKLIGKVELVGYGNTPWSQTGPPPFSSVAIDLEGLTEKSLAILDELRAGRIPKKRMVMIPPKLMVRNR